MCHSLERQFFLIDNNIDIGISIDTAGTDECKKSSRC